MAAIVLWLLTHLTTGDADLQKTGGQQTQTLQGSGSVSGTFSSCLCLVGQFTLCPFPQTLRGPFREFCMHTHTYIPETIEPQAESQYLVKMAFNTAKCRRFFN